MSTVALTKETFEDTVTRPGITLADWWASWCGPCRMFAPVFQAASEQHLDITFGKIDTEDQPELSAAARISSIPTLMAFRDGILVFSQPGALPAAALEQLIQAVRALDMDKVRADLARRRPRGQRRHGGELRHERHRGSPLRRHRAARPRAGSQQGRAATGWRPRGAHVVTPARGGTGPAACHHS